MILKVHVKLIKSVRVRNSSKMHTKNFITIILPIIYIRIYIFLIAKMILNLVILFETICR